MLGLITNFGLITWPKPNQTKPNITNIAAWPVKLSISHVDW